MLAEPASSLIVYSVILIAIYAAFWFGSGKLLKRAQNRGEKINYSKWCWYTAVFNILFFATWCAIYAFSVRYIPRTQDVKFVALAVIALVYAGAVFAYIQDTKESTKTDEEDLAEIRGKTLIGTFICGGFITLACIPLAYAFPNYEAVAVTPEYSTSTDGTRTAVSTRNQLVPQDSGAYVTVSTVEHKTSQSSSELRTVNTWLEKNNNTIRTISEYAKDSRVTIMEDVPTGETGYVEHIPVYNLTPAGLFDSTTVDPLTETLCVQWRDTGCKPNAVHAGEKIVLHVPAGGTKTSATPVNQ